MNRMDMYCEVLCESLPLSKDALKGQLGDFVERNARWRRYFETEISATEETLLEEKLRERRVGLLAWLLVCGAVSPGLFDRSAA